MNKGLILCVMAHCVACTLCLCVTPQSLGLENVPKLGGRQAQMDTLLTEEARAAQTRGTARQHTTRI